MWGQYDAIGQKILAVHPGRAVDCGRARLVGPLHGEPVSYPLVAILAYGSVTLNVIA